MAVLLDSRGLRREVLTAAGVKRNAAINLLRSGSARPIERTLAGLQKVLTAAGVRNNLGEPLTFGQLRFLIAQRATSHEAAMRELSEALSKGIGLG